MSSSLREQLVQAGLADEDKHERSNRAGKRGGAGRKGGGRKKGGAGGGQRRSKGGGSVADTQARENASDAAPAVPAKTAREPTAEEKADRLRQLIRANRIDRAYAAVPYRFTEGARVREVAVTRTQHARIARGELAVVSDGERCELVPAKTARRIRGTDPQAVLVLNTEDGGPSGGGEHDDPYAEYQVPDDLMW